MKNIAKKVVVSSKNFIVNHKTAAAVAATAIVLVSVNKQALKDHEEFLKERGLYDEFIGA